MCPGFGGEETGLLDILKGPDNRRTQFSFQSFSQYKWQRWNWDHFTNLTETFNMIPNMKGTTTIDSQSCDSQYHHIYVITILNELWVRGK